jgi:hypothetical protein
MLWTVVPDTEQEDDVRQIDVLPCRKINGRPLWHGHILGPGCDCKPTTCTRIDVVIYIHRSIV